MTNIELGTMIPSNCTGMNLEMTSGIIYFIQPTSGWRSSLLMSSDYSYVKNEPLITWGIGYITVIYM